MGEPPPPILATLLSLLPLLFASGGTLAHLARIVRRISRCAFAVLFASDVPLPIVWKIEHNNRRGGRDSTGTDPRFRSLRSRLLNFRGGPFLGEVGWMHTHAACAAILDQARAVKFPPTHSFPLHHDNQDQRGRRVPQLAVTTQTQQIPQQLGISSAGGSTPPIPASLILHVATLFSIRMDFWRI